MTGRSETIPALAPGERRALVIPLQRGLNVSGRVVDLNGTPLARVEVVMRIPGEEAGFGCSTSKDGKFAFGKMTRDDGGREWEVVARARKGFESPAFHIDGARGDMNDLVLTLDPGARLVGSVRWSDGRRVRQFQLRVESGTERRSESFQSGRFELYGLTRGPHVLEIEALESGVAESARVEGVLPDSAPLEIVLAPAPTYEVTVSVQDEQGLAITDFGVTAMKKNAPRAPWSHQQLVGMPAGEWTVHVGARGFVSKAQDIVVPETDHVAIVLVRAALLRGIVLDAKDRPVFNAVVWTKGGGSVTTDDQGRFELEAAPGTVSLQLKRFGERTWSEGPELVVSGGEERDGIELRLP